MHYVYLIRSIVKPEHTYIGLTADLQARLKNTIPEAPRIPPNTNHGPLLATRLSITGKKLPPLNNT